MWRVFVVVVSLLCSSFSVNEAQLSKSDQIMLSELDKTSGIESNLCFISAVSSNHFKEELGHIYSVKQMYPCITMYIFNLGLTEKEVSFLKKIPNVTVDVFDNGGRPYFPFGSTAFKPPLLLHFLRSYGISHHFRFVFYGDSSIFLRQPFDEAIFTEVMTNGIVAENHHGKAQISMTHPKMYPYFNYDREKDYQDILKRNPLHQIQAGLMLLDCLNETMKNDFFARWAKCANNPDCLSPDGAITLNYLPPPSTDPNFTVANGVAVYRTNRDDQSAFTFLMDEYFGRGKTTKRKVFLNPYVGVSRKKAKTMAEMEIFLETNHCQKN